MATHTKGPWKAHLHASTQPHIPGHVIKADHGAEVTIALLWQGSSFEGKQRMVANAHLIAAAPTLLARVRARFNACWCHKRGPWCPECTQDFAAIEQACDMGALQEALEPQKGAQVDAHA